MSLIPFLLISIAMTGAALILRGRPTIASSIALVGLLASLIAALAIRPGETIVIGGATLATTDFLRLFLVLGCLSGLALALVGAAGGTRRDAPAVMLGTLAAASPCAVPAGCPDRGPGRDDRWPARRPGHARPDRCPRRGHRRHPGGSRRDHRRRACDRSGSLDRAAAG